MTFVKSPYGPIAKVTPTDVQQPNSPAQRAATGRFTVVAGFWNALGVAQKQAWSLAAQNARREAADSKKGYRLSGYALYSSLANVWLNAHNNVGTPPANPPSGELGVPAITVTASASEGTVTFHASAGTPTGIVVQFELQPLRNAARKPSEGGYRVAGFSAFAPGPGSTVDFDVTPGAYAGRYCYVELSSGRRTPFVEVPVSGIALALETGGAAERASGAERPAARRKAA